MTPVLALYRVSSGEQEKAGYSIPQQRADIEAYVARSDYHIVEAVEFAESAKTGGQRKAIESVRSALERHPEVRHVLVHRIDRWARNLFDYADLTERMGIRLISVCEGFDDSPAGQFMQGVLVSQAKYDSQLKGQRVRDGMCEKAAGGGLPGKAPPGYANVPRTKTRKATVVLDPATAPVLRQMFESYTRGDMTYGDLAEDLHDHGIRTRLGHALSPEMVRRLLSHPFYMGKVRYKGELYPGEHEPIIDEDLFNRVQQVKTARSKDPGEKGTKQFLLRGLLFCGTCERRWTAEDHPKGRYYRCMPDSRRHGCRERYIPLDRLDAEVEALLPRIRTRPEHVARVHQALDRLAEERASRRLRDEDGLRKQYEGVQAKRLRLVDLYAAGEVTDEDYESVRAGYDAEMKTLSDRLAMLTEDLAGPIATVKALLEKVSAIDVFYGRCETIEERKQFLGSIIRRIVVSNRAIQRTEYHPPFHLLLEDEHAKGSGINLAAEILDSLGG